MKKPEWEGKICGRCKTRPAKMVFANSMLDYVHGNKEMMCQECYDGIMQDSDWYKHGYNDALQKVHNKLDDQNASNGTLGKLCLFCGAKIYNEYGLTHKDGCIILWLRGEMTK